MEQPCGIGSSFVLSLLSIHAVVQFNWDVDFNLFLKCHFLPAIALRNAAVLWLQLQRASSFLEGKRELVNSYLCA